MMLTKIGNLVAFGILLVTAGCIQKETTHTLYLSPDGAVSWVVSEVNVRSGEADAGKRVAEEQAYVGPALIGRHGVARALAALGPDGIVQTTVIRPERPFHVVTQARFAAVDQILPRLFREMGIRASAGTARDPGKTTLRVRLDFARELDQPETAISELFDNVEHLRFALTEGRFDAAMGFDVTDGFATLSTEWLDRAQQASEARGAIDFVLTWRVD